MLATDYKVVIFFFFSLMNCSSISVIVFAFLCHGTVLRSGACNLMLFFRSLDLEIALNRSATWLCFAYFTVSYRFAYVLFQYDLHMLYMYFRSIS